MFAIALLPLFAQQAGFPIADWEKRLRGNKGEDHRVFREIGKAFSGKDSTTIKDALLALEQKGKGAGSNFRVRMLYLKADFIHNFGREKRMVRMMAVLDEMLKIAYQSGDDSNIAFASWAYGSLMYANNQIELAATYYLKAIELYDKGQPFENLYAYYTVMGEILFHSREYEQSTRYSLKGLAGLPDSSEQQKHTLARVLNTVGQGFQKTGQGDSALHYFARSKQLAESINNIDWPGINDCFSAQVYLERKELPIAKSLLQQAILSTQVHESNIKANSLQLLAGIHLAERRPDSAARCLNEALQLLEKNSNRTIQGKNYLQQTYLQKAELHRVRQQTDSFYHYFQLYSVLHDSLERVATLSSSRLAQLRINNERNQYAIQNVLAQQEREEKNRNLIILGISLLAMGTIYSLYRQREKHKHREELALYQKAASEAEARSARGQLESFTQLLLEKSSLVEKLQEQLSEKSESACKQEVMTELSNHNIITEDDWNRFRSLFDTMYPGFFRKLKERAPDITQAELRMAALGRLQLTTRQMASILGITENGVSKGRTRLRQRIQLEADTSLEEFLASL